MPLFEYRCEDCGAKFEKLVRRSAENQPVTCPGCGQSHVQTELSTFAAHAGGGPGRMPEGGGCPSGMCRTPDICGRN